jgi:hypothetical protein
MSPDEKAFKEYLAELVHFLSRPRQEQSAGSYG